jgi:hypothetical protein
LEAKPFPAINRRTPEVASISSVEGTPAVAEVSVEGTPAVAVVSVAGIPAAAVTPLANITANGTASGLNRGTTLRKYQLI